MNLAIQARPDFATTDTVPLGFKTTVPGTFTFSVNQADGLFAGNQAIYIKDNLMNLTHNLKDSNYTFTSETGTFETRFEIVYVPMETLGNNNPALTTGNAIIYTEGRQIKIQASSEIKSVAVYDLLGRSIYQKDAISKNDFSTTEFTAEQQVVILQILLENNVQLTRKLIIK